MRSFYGGSNGMSDQKSSHRIVYLDRQTIKRGIEDGSIVLVDIREPYEFTSGHIPGSLSLPLSQFDPGALPAEPRLRTVFVCAAGVRSEKLLLSLQEAGFEFAEHYRGGIKDWVAAGESLEY